MLLVVWGAVSADGSLCACLGWLVGCGSSCPAFATLSASVLQPCKPPSLSHQIQVVAPLLRTLRILHEADVVHRDIKPENLFLSTDGGCPC